MGSGHFQFSIHNGIEAVSGIAWRMAEDVPPEETEIDIAIRLQWNTWNQKKKITNGSCSLEDSLIRD